MNRWSALALLLAFVTALVLRCPQLGVRPLHNDEAVNATKLVELWQTGHYRYNPDEYHGPTLHYLALPVLWFSPVRNSADVSETTLRVVTVGFGAGLILLLVLMADGLGRAAIGWSAVFIAVSPAMVFYSRYFIHEMLLVFFTMLTLAAGWRYAQSRQSGWALVGGAGLGLMWATKETFVLSVVAATVALLTERCWNHRATGRQPRAIATSNGIAKWVQPGKPAAAALLVAFVVAQLFFSSFLTNLQGPMDSLRAFLPWLHRAGGASPHHHPWSFYFERLLWFHPAKSLVWSEAFLFMLAILGAVAAFSTKPSAGVQPRLARFLVFYTVTLTTIYSLLSYKTPWCLLNFWLGMILLAGIGAALLLQRYQSGWGRLLLGSVLVVGMIHLGWEARLVSVDYAVSTGNPYVYAQTTFGCRDLVERVNDLASVAATGSDTVLKVVSPESYWPLPWYLRAFKHSGWWDQVPENPYAPIVIVSASLAAALDDKSQKAYLMTGLYELRPGVFMELYVNRELWEKFIAGAPRPGD